MHSRPADEGPVVPEAPEFCPSPTESLLFPAVMMGELFLYGIAV
ncbi:MAG: hypothetical protein HQM12_22405 [SAR324 cluster bacterium]|nr:hypothetical protein [SAR324 cluster bacterium]